MSHDQLSQDLFREICKVPLIDPHSHIDPHRAASRGLDDILGYHYYTELVHSAGLDRKHLGGEVPARERVRAVLSHMDRIDNTAQYSWFLEIARTFLGFEGDRVTAKDCDALCDAAEKCMARPDWEDEVLRKSNLEKVFLTNDFDDPLQGFDTNRYVPCLRTDDLVFKLHDEKVRARLAKATGVEVGDLPSLKKAVRKLFEHFVAKGAKACAISLPPDFEPVSAYYDILTDDDPDVTTAFHDLNEPDAETTAADAREIKVFWTLAECCREFGLPFDLMIGVNRRVYENGVHQGQDLFDQRTSLIQYAELFNAFPEVTFPVSVLTSNQNQELTSYAWIFPNVVTNGHWWYSNIPVFIEQDARARLQAVPKTKQIGYYSDMYKLEFGLPKFNMYRRILARVLADDFVRTKVYTEAQAVELAKLVLRENVRTIFKV
jgi:glucuronate isomerase